MLPDTKSRYSFMHHWLLSHVGERSMSNTFAEASSAIRISSHLSHILMEFVIFILEHLEGDVPGLLSKFPLKMIAEFIHRVGKQILDTCVAQEDIAGHLTPLIQKQGSWNRNTIPLDTGPDHLSSDLKDGTGRASGRKACPAKLRALIALVSIDIS